MTVDRREFLKIAGAGSAFLLAGEARATDEPQAIDCGQTYGVLVDTVVCIGCRKCEWACNTEHKLTDLPLPSYEDKSVFQRHRRPEHNAYTVVNRFFDPNTTKPYSIKVQCMHCNHPACASACIVGALRKEKQGPVSYDAWKCIGCRYCMVACPFQVPAYEYKEPLKPQVRKCTFCAHRLEEGKKPACVSICPNEALTFGTRQELMDMAHGRITASPEKYNNYVYGESEVGGTSWMYLAPTTFDQTELPKLPDEPIPPITETIQHGIFKSFIPPLALYGILGLIMHSLKGPEQEEINV
ncbi:MAG: 4Fe-4S dicluster domain-containing protein [candidate division Zixibacteria bacterium]|nr:4Fe-4S dicluster domain-containing protein [candidate division Zixibacteria bacterium]